MKYNFVPQKISFKLINKRFIIINCLLLIIFFISQIAITSVIGTKSSEIETIRVEKEKLRLENEILTSDINKEKSIENIKEVADTVNLRPTTTVQLDRTLLDNVALADNE